MKYVSVDLETTGLDPNYCQVLEVAMVLEDTENIRPLHELPFFHARIRHWGIHGEPVALAMNAGLLASMEELESNDAPAFVWERAEVWLEGQGFHYDKEIGTKVHPAGKNFGNFDSKFLPPHVSRYFKHRAIDPGNVFMDWEVGVPGMSDLLPEGREVKHTALGDALDVIEVLRKSYIPFHCPKCGKEKHPKKLCS